MSLKVIVLAIPLLAVSASSLGQALEKNGLPCVAEICIGDGIAELAKVQWTPAQNAIKINNKTEATANYKLNDDKLRELKAIYPVAGEAAPFLHQNQFDSTALAAIAKVTGACQTNELIGTYGAASSTPTRVGISLTPNLADPTRQAWTVTTIVREFPSAVTNDERSEISKLLKQRYAKFGAGNQSEPSAKPGEGRFFPSGMTRFGFGLSLVRDKDEENMMKRHPICRSDAIK